ncbi:glycosyltransferase family 2 protein [Planctomycetota bacterium]
MDVSIIIVNWNTRNILHNCLRSVYQQSKNVNFEVIVIDNGSTDSSVAMVQSEFPDVIVIGNPENRGFAAANNQGIAAAKGRYILLLNSDTIVLENSISNTIRFADANPDAAVVGCRILNPDRTLQLTCFMFPLVLNMLLSSTYLYKLFPNNRFFGRERMTWWQRDNVKEVDVVTGCFMLVRRQAIEQVGVMDEQFFMYGEETDWCYRFKQAGWKILFTPGAQIIHIHGASTEQIKPQMILQLRGSILLFLKKHKNRFVYALACLLVAVFFLLRIPYWLTRAAISSSGRDRYICTARTYIKGMFGALFGGRGLCMER